MYLVLPRYHTRHLLPVTIAGSFVFSTPVHAQPLQPSGARLTVRPHEMATGTRTVQAGARVLPALDSAIIYVPTQCVGTRRVPLLVVMHGGGGSARNIMDTQRSFADQYGMILLAPNSPAGHWAPTPDAVAKIDSALKIVLHEYAIDADKIGITGMSEGGMMTSFLGRSNRDVFSRIATESPAGYFASDGPQSRTTQFLTMAGLQEEGDMWSSIFDITQQERQGGGVAEVVMVLRGHERRAQDEAIIWHWFQQSWASAGVPVLTAKRADSTLVMTTELFDKLNVFWNRFMDGPMAIRDAGHKHPTFMEFSEELQRQWGLPPRTETVALALPDSISPTGRRATQKWVSLIVGQERVLVQLMDIQALAMKHPSVAADLHAAGLVAEQAEAVRTALLSALATIKASNNKAGAVVPGSALERNIAFVQSHPAEMKALDQVGMWDIP